VPLDRKLVWVLRDGVATPVLFKPGVSDGSVTEVLEGDLHPGDHVIIEAISSRASAPRIL
jgi:HlyD family secretion protein